MLSLMAKRANARGEVPAKGSKTKSLTKKPKRGKKGKKKGPPNQCGQGQKEDSDEALTVTPDHKGPRGPPLEAAVYSTTY